MSNIERNLPNFVGLGFNIVGTDFHQWTPTCECLDIVYSQPRVVPLRLELTHTLRLGSKPTVRPKIVVRRATRNTESGRKLWMQILVKFGPEFHTEIPICSLVLFQRNASNGEK